jgi:hypothetical protein
MKLSCRHLFDSSFSVLCIRYYYHYQNLDVDPFMASAEKSPFDQDGYDDDSDREQQDDQEEEYEEEEDDDQTRPVRGSGKRFLPQGAVMDIDDNGEHSEIKSQCSIIYYCSSRRASFRLRAASSQGAV